jgi:hypothetical protein
MNKQTILVFDKDNRLVDTVKRKLRFEPIGNFVPAFATYKSKEYLVNSFQGDLSDPFRANESYLTSLYINLK